MTIAVMVWPLLPLLGSVFSMGIGGEIKKVERSQFVGMVGSVIFCGLMFALFALLSNRAFGYDFQGSLAYNFLTGAGESTAVAPYFPLLAGVLTNNVLLTLIIAITFAIWIYFWLPGMLAYANRAMMAWSFDRFGPAWLGEVSSHSAVPINAILVTVIFAVVSLALWTFTTFFSTLQIFAANCLTWGIACLVGAAFPYTRPQFFNESVIAKYKLGPIPWMTIVNLISAVFLFWMFTLLWNDSIAAGHSPAAVGSYIVIMTIGLVYYFIVYAVRRQQGYDPTLPFKVIPEE
jgi:amino acid transporter